MNGHKTGFLAHSGLTLLYLANLTPRTQTKMLELATPRKTCTEPIDAAINLARDAGNQEPKSTCGASACNDPREQKW